MFFLLQTRITITWSNIIKNASLMKIIIEAFVDCYVINACPFPWISLVMILFGVDLFRIKFSVVSEPDDEDEDCEDVGVAYADLKGMLDSGRDMENEDIPSE